MFLPSGAQEVFSVRDQIVNILGFIDHGVPSINALFFSFCLSVVAFKSCENVTFLSSLAMSATSLFLFLSPDPLFTREYFLDCSSYPLSTIQHPPGTQLPKETFFLYPFFPLEGS